MKKPILSLLFLLVFSFSCFSHELAIQAAVDCSNEDSAGLIINFKGWQEVYIEKPVVSERVLFDSMQSFEDFLILYKGDKSLAVAIVSLKSGESEPVERYMLEESLGTYGFKKIVFQKGSCRGQNSPEGVPKD